jgi:hypothetical protein
MRRFPMLLSVAVLLVGPATASLASSAVPILGSKLKIGTVNSPHIRLETTKTISTDNTNNTPSDPVLNGGSIRIFSTTGDVFDHTYPLPVSLQWRYYGLVGQNRGYDYIDSTKTNGPIGIVRVRNNKMTRVIGTGLDFSLHANPDPVTVVLTLGDRSYCMTFGGVVSKFIPDTKFTSLRAPAPASCP